MFIYRIYKIKERGQVAVREDMAIDIDTPDAIKRAEAVAVDCVVELWRGSNLLATFRPPWPIRS